MWSLSLIRQSTKCDGYKSCEVEIWSILIFNVRRRIHMIVLLQSAAIQFGRLFKHISYYKAWQSNFITKCERLLLQSASGITKCDRLLLQVRQVLQSVTSVTKWLRHKICFTVLQGFIYQVLLCFKFARYHITFIFQTKLINF